MMLRDGRPRQARSTEFCWWSRWCSHLGGKGNSSMSKVTRLVCYVTLGITLLACAVGGGQAILTPKPPERPKPVATSEMPPQLSETPLSTDTRIPPTSGPTEDAGPVLLITPYVDESDMAKAMGFSIDSNSPWGFAHTGIDFAPSGDLRAFRAACPGVVDMVELWQLESTLNWQVSVRIACNSRYSAIYAFEPMTAVEADGETQLANILVVEGQSVVQGDLIGLLPYAGPGCHVDFGFYDGWDRTCPEPFFAPEAKASILNLIHVEWPGATMCY